MAELALSIVLHAALGLGLAALVWIVGLGWVARLRARGALAAVDAYPLGLLAVVLAALALLVSWWLAPVAVLLLLPAVGAPIPLLARALRPLAWAAAPALGLPIALGFLLHGPTAEIDSSAYGDMLYYVNKIVSAADDLVPFRDLLVAGQNIIYAEGGPSYVGAVVAHADGFDPVLAQTTTMPAFLFVSACVGLGLRGIRVQPPLAVLALGLVATGLIAYPTWITESPPVAMAVPLAFSLQRLVHERIPIRWLLGLTAVIGVDLLLTKVTGLTVAGVVLALVYWERRREFDPRLVAGMLAALVVVLVALLFATVSWYKGLLHLEFVPADAARGLWRQVSVRDTHAAAASIAIAGQLTVLAALVRVRAWPVASALGASVVGSWLIGGLSAGLDVAIAMSILLAAIELWTRPDAVARVRGLVLASGGLLAISAWFRDVSGVRAGLVFVLVLATAMVAAFGAAGGLARRQLVYVLGAGGAAIVLGMSGRSFVAFVVAAALVAAAFAPRRVVLAAIAAAAGAAVAAAALTDLRLSEQGVTLSTDDYAVWKRVADVVPEDGLVFTSLTGEVVDGRQGWNNYPSIAGRQIYLAGWYDGKLTSQPEERARRLDLNRRVLEGRLSPTALELDRPYSSYWAVVWKGAGIPVGFRRVYENGTFELYRIVS